MIPTWFLSMWMSNTATALLMVTIVEALLDRIDSITEGNETKPPSSPTKSEILVDQEVEVDETYLPPDQLPVVDHQTKQHRTKWQKFGVALSLGVCFSASCGGMATLTGTPTNVVFFNLLNT